MATNEQIIQEGLLDITSQALPEVEKGDWQALQLTANAFLERVHQIGELARMVKSQRTISSELQAIYYAMRTVDNFSAQAVSLQHQFEERVNSFLGRTIYLTYVMTDGNMSFLDEAHIGQLYQTATKAYGRGNISAGNVMETQDLEQDLLQRVQNSIAQRKDVYTTILGMVNNPDNDRRFYWHELNENHKRARQYTVRFTNMGPIAEGYVGAVINEDGAVTNAGATSQAWYRSLKALYWNHIEFDSIPAVVKGDIVWQEDGNIQFAVKTGSFSMARFGQYVRLAINITKISALTTEQFRQALPKLVQMSKIARQIAELSKEGATEEIDKIAQEIAAKFKLTIQVG